MAAAAIQVENAAAAAGPAAVAEADNAAALVAAAAFEDVVLAGEEDNGNYEYGTMQLLAREREHFKVGLGAAGWFRRGAVGGADSCGRSDPRVFPRHNYDHREARGCSFNDARVG